MNWKMVGRGTLITIMMMIISTGIRYWSGLPIDETFVSMLIGVFFGGLFVSLSLSNHSMGD
jgi:hypothetical protein